MPTISCRNDGTGRGKAHFGDPCIWCDTPWDRVAVGPCPGRPGLERTADMQLTIDRLMEALARVQDELAEVWAEAHNV